MVLQVDFSAGRKNTHRWNVSLLFRFFEECSLLGPYVAELSLQCLGLREPNDTQVLQTIANIFLGHFETFFPWQAHGVGQTEGLEVKDRSQPSGKAMVWV